MLPFTGARLMLASGPAPEPVPVGARIAGRDEFAGETVLTLVLDGRHAPLSALELDTPAPLFTRRVTVTVRDVRDLVASERVPTPTSVPCTGWTSEPRSLMVRAPRRAFAPSWR